MKRTTVLSSLALLVSLGLGIEQAGAAEMRGAKLLSAAFDAWSAPQQAGGEKPAGWSGRDEYDAHQAMIAQADPAKRIALAEALLQKWPNAYLKDVVYVAMMQGYAQLGDSGKAIAAAEKATEANPDNLQALGYLSFAFPFVFKLDDPDAAAKLSRAETNGRRGLEALQKLQKPASVSDEQFTQVVKGQRSLFNGVVGFVALQRKDYAAAITVLKTANEDNPSDVYNFYRLGLAYLYSSPPDYNNALWNLARAVALAKAAQNPQAGELEKYLKRAYVNYHGNDEGLADVQTQAAGSPTPPEGFKIAQMETPKQTGNASVDAFNQTFFQLKLGGDRAQKLWDGLKGQPFGVGGFVESVEKGTDAGTHIVRIDILDQSKTADSQYDIELRDSTQPNVKNLGKGDAVHFQGTIASYTATPNLVITLENGKINDDDIPDQPRVTSKPKPKPRPAPTRRTTTRKRPA